jgi:hypothetical protein
MMQLHLESREKLTLSLQPPVVFSTVVESLSHCFKMG